MRKVLHVYFNHNDGKRSFITVHQNRKGEPLPSRVMFEEGRPAGEMASASLHLTHTPGEPATVIELSKQDWEALQKTGQDTLFFRAVMSGGDRSAVLAKAHTKLSSGQRSQPQNQVKKAMVGQPA